MKSRANSLRLLTPTVAGLALLGIALVGLGGCPQQPNGNDPSQVLAGASTTALTAGEFTDRIMPGTQVVYEIQVGAGEAFELVARSVRGAVLGIGFIEAPDGRVFMPDEFQPTASQDRPFAVQTVPIENGGAGFRVAGVSSTAGVWRISVFAAPVADLEALGRQIERKSTLENFFLLLYLLNGPSGQPDSFDLIGAFARLAFPEIVALERALDVAFDLNIQEAEKIDLDTPPTSLPPVVPLADGNTDTGDADDAADGSGGDDAGDDGASGGDDGAGGGDNGSGGGDGSGDGGGDGSGDGGDDTGDDGDDDPGPPPTQIILEEVIRSGDPVPGQVGASFLHFGNPTMDAEGRVAFWASYTGGTGDGGLYVVQNGTLERVLDDDPATAGVVPSKESTDYFGNLKIEWDEGSHPLSWGRDGRLIFVGITFGEKNSRGVYRWRATDGDMIRVVDMEQVIPLFPDAPDFAFFCDFRQINISDAGIVSWVMRYTYITNDREAVLGKHGVFASNGIEPWIIRDHRNSFANRGDVPDQGGSAFFMDFPDLSTGNPGGDVLFQASHALGNGDRGVYLARDGSLFRVVDNASGRSFPGLPASTVVGQPQTDYDAIAIGPRTDIAIDTTLTVGGATRDAVILWDGSEWHELTGTGGEPATGLLSGVNRGGQVIVLVDDKPHLGDGAGLQDLTQSMSDALIAADPTWEPIPGALNNRGRALLRYTRGGGSTPGMAFWTGKELIVVADAASNVPALDFDTIFAMAGPETDRPDRTGALTNADELVFRVGSRGGDGEENTPDDVQAIYIGRAQ